MAASKYPTKQYPSSNFLIAAGSILFRRCAESHKWQICLLHHRVRKEWLLPKGRKDRGETIEVTAVRETFEETGYPCKLFPVRMPTRAPETDVDRRDMVEVIDNITEPFALTIREEKDGVKTIWWFITRVKGEKAVGTPRDAEPFDSHFIDADKAVETLTFQLDRELVMKALAIVEGCNGKTSQSN